MVGSPVVSVLLAVNEASILVCTTCCVLAVECLKRSAFSNSNMQYLSQWSPANQAVTLYSFDFFQITIEHFCNICLSVLFLFFLKTKNNCGGFQLWATKSYTSRKYRAELSLTSPVMCSEHTDSVKWVLLNRAHFFSKKKISDVTKWLKLVTVLDVCLLYETSERCKNTVIESLFNVVIVTKCNNTN